MIETNSKIKPTPPEEQRWENEGGEPTVLPAPPAGLQKARVQVVQILSELLNGFRGHSKSGREGH